MGDRQGRVCVLFSKKTTGQSIYFIYLFIVVAGNLLPPSISTAVWSVNSPSLSYKPLLHFGNSPSHLVSHYATRPVSNLSFPCEPGRRCLPPIFTAWRVLARASLALQRILSFSPTCSAGVARRDQHRTQRSLGGGRVLPSMLSLSLKWVQFEARCKPPINGHNEGGLFWR